MIKYLECPDLHYDPKWYETFEMVSNAIIKAAKENKVDFIALPGDLFNRPLVATDKGGYNTIRKIIKTWSSICPVVAIQGTPSHDGYGCYESLEDCGLTLLKPNKVYGYSETFKNILCMDKNHVVNCILFGIPEINKNNIMSKLSVSAEAANAEAIKLFNKYVADFIAPNRMKYQDVPAVALFHGIVSDFQKINSDDIIIRSSDIVIHAENLKVANIDRWSLGHLHKPLESRIVNGGYAGSWSLNWGETGFIPGMNLIEINESIHTTRIPYGTPERIKVTGGLNFHNDKFDKAAFWVETNDPNFTWPQEMHPLSRITYIKEKRESQRVTQEQAAKIKTLADLFKILDPDVTKPVLDKVDIIDTTNEKLKTKQLDIKLKSLVIKGCKFFKGKTVEFDLKKINNNLTGIAGDNGAGKSSLLSFCSPYPVVIGKDTLSGRPSAIKDFFSEQDSIIDKVFDVGGEEHRHLITIKGAHTKAPKVECYLLVDGVQALEKATFDAMMQECENLYGSFNDYFLTTFYAQPMQGKTQSSLMTANMTDIRNLVQNIAGIDRESEKRIALDKVKELDTLIEHKSSWLNGACAFSVDVGDIEETIKAFNISLDELRDDLEAKESIQFELKKEIKELQEKKSKNDIEINNKEIDSMRITDIDYTIKSNYNTIETLEERSGSLDSNKKLLETIIETEKLEAENREIKIKYDNDVLEYNKELHELQSTIDKLNTEKEKEYNETRSRYDNVLNISTQRVETISNKIKNLNKPCINCNWIDPNAKEEIEVLTEEKAKHLKILHNLIEPVEPDQTLVPVKLDRPLPKAVTYHAIFPIAESKESIMQKIEDGTKASAEIESLEKQLASLEKELKELKEKTYNITEGIEEQLKSHEESYNHFTELIQIINTSITQTETQIKEKQNQIEKEKLNKVAINQAKKIIKDSTDAKADWQYIANMLQASKIPALELDIVKDSIDAEATKIIKPFLDERYIIETETQTVGKDKIVDKFDIKIHDLEDGQTKSFLQYNPGHKAFFNDAYVKALIKIRNEKACTKYSPVILDEADGPIQPERISQFYEMQKNYWNDTKVLIVSHSPTSHEYIDGKINIKELY
jgi:predicted MPP superfamily phosphohydrolase